MPANHSASGLTTKRTGEGKCPTTIRSVSLRRAKVIAAHIGGISITDFVSNAVDEAAAKLVTERGITLPPDAKFVTA